MKVKNKTNWEATMNQKAELTFFGPLDYTASRPVKSKYVHSINISTFASEVAGHHRERWKFIPSPWPTSELCFFKNPFVKNTSLPDIHTRFSAWRSSFFPSHQRPTFGWGVFVPSVVCSTPQRSLFPGGTGTGSLPCPKLTPPRRRSVLWHPFSVCRQWRGTSILGTGGWGSRSAQSLRISSVWKIGHRWRTQPRSGRNGPWGQAGFAHIQWHLWAREGQVMITTSFVSVHI